MQEVSVCPGDPVLVLALAEGWASNASRTASAVPSRLLATAGEDLGKAVGQPAAPAAEAETERGVEDCRRGVDGVALKAQSEAGAHGEQPPPVGVEQHRDNLLTEGVATLTCFLCTVWTNPHLAPTETAVDGRVNIPLSSTATAAAMVRVAQYGPELRQPPPEATATNAEELTDGMSLLSNTAKPALAHPKPSPTATITITTTDPAADGLITRFLKTAVERHLAGTGMGLGDGSCGADPVVGIIPVHALTGGFGTATFAGGRPGCGGDVPPVAGRVSARVIFPPRRRGGPAPVVAKAAVGAAREAPTTAAPLGGGSSGRSGGESLAIALNHHQQEQQQQQPGQEQHRRFLPPEYTSLVKRSLRHLLVSDGCEIAVPSCPDDVGGMAMATAGTAAGSGMQGPQAGSNNNSGGGNGRGQQKTLPEDGTALVRIAIGGAGDGHQRGGSGGALSALISGCVSAIGPESLLLVEDGASAGVVGVASTSTGVAAAAAPTTAAATALRGRGLRERGSEGEERDGVIDRHDIGGCGEQVFSRVALRWGHTAVRPTKYTRVFFSVLAFRAVGHSTSR